MKSLAFELSADESRLLAAYRAMDDRARRDFMVIVKAVSDAHPRSDHPTVSSDRKQGGAVVTANRS